MSWSWDQNHVLIVRMKLCLDRENKNVWITIYQAFSSRYTRVNMPWCRALSNPNARLIKRNLDHAWAHERVLCYWRVRIRQQLADPWQWWEIPEAWIIIGNDGKSLKLWSEDIESQQAHWLVVHFPLEDVANLISTPWPWPWPWREWALISGFLVVLIMRCSQKLQKRAEDQSGSNAGFSGQIQSAKSVKSTVQSRSLSHWRSRSQSQSR